MTALWTKLANDRRGSSVVELGLVAPVLAGLFIGMVDLSRAYSERLKLEQAAQRTVEKVMQQHEMLTDYTTQLKSDGAAAAGVAESAVNPSFYMECSTNGTSWTRTATFTTACPSGTLYYRRYVSVAITKEFRPLFGSDLFPGANANGTYSLTGTAGVRIQ